MRMAIKPKRVMLITGMIIAGLAASPALAGDPKIIHVAGKAQLLEAKGESPTQATVGAKLKPGSKIVVVGKGSVEIKIGTESINATVGDDTLIEYTGRSFFKGVERFTLQKGGALFKIKKGDKLDVKTPHVVASVRGTEFHAHTDKGRSSISVISGRVHTADSRGNNLELHSDSYAVIDERGIVEVGKGRYGHGIPGKVGVEKNAKVNSGKKSSTDIHTGALKSKPAKKGPTGKFSSQKDPSDESGTSKGNAGSKSAGGGNAGEGNADNENAGNGNSGNSGSKGASQGKGNSGNSGSKGASQGKGNSEK